MGNRNASLFSLDYLFSSSRAIETISIHLYDLFSSSRQSKHFPFTLDWLFSSSRAIETFSIYPGLAFFLFKGNRNTFHLPWTIFFPLQGQSKHFPFTLDYLFSSSRAIETLSIYPGLAFFLFKGNRNTFHLPWTGFFPLHG